MDHPALKNYILQNTPCPVPFFQTITRRRQELLAPPLPPPPQLQESNTTAQSPNMSANVPSVPPPEVPHTIVTFPAPGVLLATLNRPEKLNAIPTTQHHALHALWEYLDTTPALRVGILTGTGRAFCAGADLSEWNDNAASNKPRVMPPSGFGGISRRAGLKPVILAVPGLCLGGGFEMAINSDLIIASSTATFALPEVRRGVVAVAGALPRLIRTVGRQRAMEMALTGRSVGAAEAREWGIVNTVVDVGVHEGDFAKVGELVVREAVRVAGEIVEGSPDSVIVSRAGIVAGWEGIGVEEATEKVAKGVYKRMDGGGEYEGRSQVFCGEEETKMGS